MVSRRNVHVCYGYVTVLRKVDFGLLEFYAGLFNVLRCCDVCEGDVVFDVGEESASFVCVSVCSVWGVIGDVWCF